LRGRAVDEASILPAWGFLQLDTGLLREKIMLVKRPREKTTMSVIGDIASRTMAESFLQSSHGGLILAGYLTQTKRDEIL
jgi:hypothetical protein